MASLGEFDGVVDTDIFGRGSDDEMFCEGRKLGGSWSSSAISSSSSSATSSCPFAQLLVMVFSNGSLLIVSPDRPCSSWEGGGDERDESTKNDTACLGGGGTKPSVLTVVEIVGDAVATMSDGEF